MQYKLVTVLAAALGATQVATYSHGEESEFNGLAVRWQQLARGVFTGVPVEEWDSKKNKRSNAELDLNEISRRYTHPHSPPHWNGSHPHHPPARDLEHEARNTPGNCQLTYPCYKFSNGPHVLDGFDIFFQLADFNAQGAGMEIFDFLKAPFVGDAGGATMSAVISGQIDGNTKTECSTMASQDDSITSAVHAALAKTPDAGELSVQVNGPSGSWTINVAAVAEGGSPSATC